MANQAPPSMQHGSGTLMDTLLWDDTIPRLARNIERKGWRRLKMMSLSNILPTRESLRGVPRALSRS